MYISPKMSAYRRDSDETKYISFFYKRWWIIKKYNEIWQKVKNCIKKEFDSKLVHNQKYPKTKIKSSNGKINTNFSQ